MNPKTMVRAVILSAVVVGCGGGLKQGAGGGASHPLARHAAPDVELKMRKGGESWHPVDAEGKVLVIDFWATWCGPCRESFPRLDEIYKKHQSDGLMVVGVDEDEDPKGVAEFVRATGASFPIALDPEGEAASLYKVGTMPSEFVIDKHGVVRYVHAGYHPDDMQALDEEVSKLLHDETSSSDDAQGSPDEKEK